MSMEDVAKAFVEHYYKTLDANPDGLGTIYGDRSMMTFEGNQLMGQQAIMQKLRDIGQLEHSIKSMDVQPSLNDQSLVLFVTGAIKIGSDGNPLHFCQMFQLFAAAPGAWVIHNDIFRLNYGL